MLTYTYISIQQQLSTPTKPTHLIPSNHSSRPLPFHLHPHPPKPTELTDHNPRRNSSKRHNDGYYQNNKFVRDREKKTKPPKYNPPYTRKQDRKKPKKLSWLRGLRSTHQPRHRSTHRFSRAILLLVGLHAALFHVPGHVEFDRALYGR